MGHLLSQLQVVESSKVVTSDFLSLEIGEELRILPGRREVNFGRLPHYELQVVAKCFLPHPKQTRDWRREWDGLLRLQSLGLPAPTPLAVCENTEGSVYVLMEYLTSAVTLGEFIASAGCDELRACMEHLAKLVGSLHEAGARQADQHINNWALSNSQIYLLDAGTYHFEDEPLRAVERVLDLAAICVTLPPQAERLFRESLASTYEDDAGVCGSAGAEANLRDAILQIQKKRVRRYYKKSQRACTEFGQLTAGSWRGMFSHAANPDLIASFFQNPDALMDQGERIKSGNTCTVQRFCYREQNYVLKRYNIKAWRTCFRRSLGASRACKSWASSWVLNMSFIPTALCDAFAEEQGCLLKRSYLLMRQVDAVLLPEYVAQHRNDAERIALLVEGVGRIWDQLARINAVHGDLKATNWMVDDAGEVSLIDLDSFRFGLSASAFKHGREKDMKRFLENWRSEPKLAADFYQRLKPCC